MISVNVDFSSIEKSLKVIQKANEWEAIASIIYAKILKLVNSSRNVNGRRYKPYTTSYRTWRVKNGFSGVVNLQRGDKASTLMIKHISFKATNKGFVIFINGDLNNKKAIWLNSHKNWKFFEWGTQLEKELDRALNILIRKI